MVHIAGVNDIVMWIGFIVLIIIFLVLDLGLFNKKKRVVSIKQALTWTGIWVGLSLLFSLIALIEYFGC